MFKFVFLLASVLASPLVNAPFNIAGKGWQGFEYGNRGTEIHAAYTAVTADDPIVLRITDTSRPGAAFHVIDNGERVLTTPIPAVNSVRCPTTNPLRAYNSAAWSHGHVVIPSGYHHIRVFMRFSPWGEGMGALVAEPGEKCPHEAGRFFLVQNQVEWDSAESLCKAYGGRLADIRGPIHARMTPERRAKLMRQAFTVVHACSPDNGLAWIKGQPSKNLGEEDFPGSIKAISETEGITGAEWEMSQLSTLCQKIE